MRNILIHLYTFVTLEGDYIMVIALSTLSVTAIYKAIIGIIAVFTAMIHIENARQQVYHDEINFLKNTAMRGPQHEQKILLFWRDNQNLIDEMFHNKVQNSGFLEESEVLSQEKLEWAIWLKERNLKTIEGMIRRQEKYQIHKNIHKWNSAVYQEIDRVQEHIDISQMRQKLIEKEANDEL